MAGGGVCDRARAVTGSALADARPEGMSVRGLGPHRLKDLDRTERVYQ